MIIEFQDQQRLLPELWLVVRLRLLLNVPGGMQCQVQVECALVHSTIPPLPD